MALFKFRLWRWIGPRALRGANLVSAGLYPLRGWHTVLLWIGNRHAIALPLPVRVRVGW